jgi:PRC-barrel domain
MTQQETIDRHLEELRGSGFEIAGGQPDITHWDVKARNGKIIGKVKDLLFDPASRKVRYLIIDLDDNELGIDKKRKVLVPIGIAELYTRARRREPSLNVDPAYSIYNPADDGNVVFLPTISAEQLDMLPLYEPGHHLSRYVEVAICKIVETPEDNTKPEDDFYRNQYFSDEGFYGPEK